jgi:hypothetical protein
MDLTFDKGSRNARGLWHLLKGFLRRREAGRLIRRQRKGPGCRQERRQTDEKLVLPHH